ncbi:MAG TPA: DUF1015 domain-containing protein [Verrucomicrobiae bacterium]|nr:DUF1015 domain-containing protein [Verrucomicrobiae bacterium]
MARIFPFQPYRYSLKAGPIEKLVTQPYDKISPEMQTRYLAQNPNNLVRVILGERLPSDNEQQNVYTRAAGYLTDWIASGILAQEAEPSLYAYFQEFSVPDTGEKLNRKGFIGVGAVEDYSENVVHRHEQTLSGPKKDRMELLKHTHAHFGQIFMLYPDPKGEIDQILDEAAKSAPLGKIVDEYGATHTFYKISDPARVAKIQQLMSDKKLLIADGHHRYETALAFRKGNPNLPESDRAMMTFVNMNSNGLRILATHRLVNGLENFQASDLLASLDVRKLAGIGDLKAIFTKPDLSKVRIGIVVRGLEGVYLMERARAPRELDVEVLHKEILAGKLGIGEDAIREERFLKYARGIDPAFEAVQNGKAQVAFLLEPTTIEQVADIAFSGGVMPQKSTDFYPKLLSGLTIYRLPR